jgi:hypothetical protein
MEQQLQAGSSEQEEEQFLAFLVRYPVLCRRVLRDLEVLQMVYVRMLGCPAPGCGSYIADVVEGRMVATRLFLVAWESGYVEVASRFYVVYVKFCLMLLAYHPW